LDDVDILAEALVLALAVGDVRLNGTVELDLQRIWEGVLVFRCVDEAGEDLIALFQDDIFAKLVDSDSGAIGGVDCAPDSEGIGEARALQGVFCEQFVGFGGVEGCETLDLGPVFFIFVLEVEVDELSELFGVMLEGAFYMSPLGSG
jgi:hypothetical protein